MLPNFCFIGFFDCGFFFPIAFSYFFFKIIRFVVYIKTVLHLKKPLSVRVIATSDLLRPS